MQTMMSENDIFEQSQGLLNGLQRVNDNDLHQNPVLISNSEKPLISDGSLLLLHSKSTDVSRRDDGLIGGGNVFPSGEESLLNGVLHPMQSNVANPQSNIMQNMANHSNNIGADINSYINIYSTNNSHSIAGLTAIGNNSLLPAHTRLLNMANPPNDMNAHYANSAGTGGSILSNAMNSNNTGALPLNPVYNPNNDPTAQLLQNANNTMPKMLLSDYQSSTALYGSTGTTTKYMNGNVPSGVVGQRMSGSTSVINSYPPSNPSSSSVLSAPSSGHKSKPWHNEAAHKLERDKMTHNITSLLQARRPNANPDWLHKLPQMAKKLEESLYAEANDFESYRDSSSLKVRLQHLALSMGGKSKTVPQPQTQSNMNVASLPNSSMQLPLYPNNIGNNSQMSRPNTNPNMNVYGSNTQIASNTTPSLTPQMLAQQQGQKSMNLLNNNRNLGYPTNNNGNIQQLSATTYPGNGNTLSSLNLTNPLLRNISDASVTSNTSINSGIFSNNNSMLAPISGVSTMSSQNLLSNNMNSSQPPPRQFVNMSSINPLVNQNLNTISNGSGSSNNNSSTINSSDNNLAIAFDGDMDRDHGGDSMSTGNNAMASTHTDTSINELSNTTKSNQNGSSSSSSSGGGNGSGHSEEHRRQVLKQQQQRLLLLRHASKCPHDAEGNCTVTPHCASMKVLWKHIMNCKEQECKVAHCVSSRYVLSHYSKCRDTNCPVCAPVREAIRRSYSKSQQIQQIISNNDSSGIVSNKFINTMSSNSELAKQQARDEQFVKKMRPNESTSQNAIDPVSCALYSFTEEQILAHIESLQEGFLIKSKEISEICMPLIIDILNHNNGYVFANPVDPIALNIPDYRTIVKQPMDLGTIKKRLDFGYYRDVQECVADVRLCFDNAMLYNPKNCEVHTVAKAFKRSFDANIKIKMDKYALELKHNRECENNCNLCGEVTLKFEPPVYYCNGKCSNQRIRRHAFYYVYGNNAYHWCNTCFNDLKESFKIPEGLTVYKRDLVKKKHEEEFEEPWVMCTGCSVWVHQICTLFNSRRNISEDTKFFCPDCILKQRKIKGGINIIPASKTQAKDLPHTIMTEFLEQRVLERLEVAYKERAEMLGQSITEVEKCPAISIRQVSATDKNQPTREGIFQRYKHKNFPSEFPCRSKCIILFQNIDGQDVVLFGMYVYEYGHKCPAPNQRRVYISYLDSVHYFRPRYYRTLVYHEILISYLEYVKARGFHTAHIWACPPLKGDDYIMYCHPQDQKTPKDDRLRQWYVQILEICKRRGIVHEVVDMHTEYLANPANDATVIPYFEGDYWVGEAENIIKNLGNADVFEDDDDGEVDDNSGDDGRLKSKRKTKSKTKLKTTKRTRGYSSGRDPVIAKFASIIEPMKDAFFVARLHPLSYALEKEQLRQIELQNETKSSSSIATTTTMTSSSSMTDTTKMNNQENGKSGKSGKLEQSIKVENNSGSNNENQLGCETGKSVVSDVGTCESKIDESNKMEIDSNNTENTEMVNTTTSISTSTIVKMEVDDSSNAGDNNTINTNIEIKSEKVSADDIKTEQIEIKQEIIQISIAEKMLQKLKDDTEDVDDTQDCEHFETRQALLNLCQGNHYQFDQLRRAKHTSLMILYHLHNPDAPKFIITCATCTSDILSGYRHHCETCDSDICSKCYKGNKCTRCNTTLRPLVVSGGQPAVQLTEEQRIERNKNIQLHLTLLLHATSCRECQSKNCFKMKEFLRHESICKDGGLAKHCAMCVRVNNLLTLHARNCRQSECQVPKCTTIKENMRQNSVLQQQMDDRRRNQMNEIYGGGHRSTSNNSDK